jgi:hypothetical protein
MLPAYIHVCGLEEITTDEEPVTYLFTWEDVNAPGFQEDSAIKYSTIDIPADISSFVVSEGPCSIHEYDLNNDEEGEVLYSDSVLEIVDHKV